MSLREAPCPSCGAPLEFRNAATVLVVCASCGGASTRKGLDLEKLGKVAEVTPLDSLLDLGTRGRIEGKGWTAVGQVQLDHGAGPWNEWCLSFDDGTWGWLAEAQGELLFTRPVERASVPPHDRLSAGDAVDLGKHGHFVLAERGRARVVSVRGEIPVKAAPGSTRLYADLRQGKEGFATLDYGNDQTCDAVFVGRSVTPAEAGLDPGRGGAPGAGPRRAEADRIQCAACGGEIRIRDPEAALRVGCASCGAILDPRSPDAGVLEAAIKVKSRPMIPLGARGKIRGVEVEVIAFLVRSVRVMGIRYPWAEYLLKVKGGRYRWLAESNGHWLLLEPLSAGELKEGGRVWCEVGGRRFRHFQGGDAVVDLVLGEVYWEVKRGETVRSDDYVRPPECVSIEKDGKEINATLGSYATKEEIEVAFGMPGKLREPVGVAPAQPAPDPGAVRKWWLLCGSFAAADVGITFWGMSTGNGAWAFPGCMTLPFLLLPAIAAWAKADQFERARWAESDHAPGDDEGEGTINPTTGCMIPLATGVIALVVLMLGGC